MAIPIITITHTCARLYLTTGRGSRALSLYTIGEGGLGVWPNRNSSMGEGGFRRGRVYSKTRSERVRKGNGRGIQDTWRSETRRKRGTQVTTCNFELNDSRPKVVHDRGGPTTVEGRRALYEMTLMEHQCHLWLLVMRLWAIQTCVTTFPWKIYEY
jgi:hypothetical protein